jgi:hypothetical protein
MASQFNDCGQADFYRELYPVNFINSVIQALERPNQWKRYYP